MTAPHYNCPAWKEAQNRDELQQVKTEESQIREERDAWENSQGVQELYLLGCMNRSIGKTGIQAEYQFGLAM